MRFVGVSLLLFFAGCAGTGPTIPADFAYMPVVAGDYTIATWQKITDPKSPIHIYIEGDGHAFNAYGTPMTDPTPRGMVVRRMAFRDPAPNVVYMARPCQFVRSDACSVADWTSGRFSEQIVNAMSAAISDVAGARPVVLVGYSGGAMISGLIIRRNPNLHIKKWITIAGVLNHRDWTRYFNDSPLKNSLNLNTLPRVPQHHYVANGDKVVPYKLSQKWTVGHEITVVPNASHGDFGDFIPDFD